MSKKRLETSRGEKPPKIDDLKLINGIGPVVERRLHGVGTYTFAQLAALSPADIAAAAGSGGLTSERIIKQDWIGQARKLAAGSISSEAREGVEIAAPAAEKTESAPRVVTPPGSKEAHTHSPLVTMRGTPHLIQIETVPTGTNTPQNCFPYSQPLNVRLTLDLSDVRVPANTQLSYRASIHSKSLEGHPRQAVGDSSGIVTSTDKVTVNVEGVVLPKGTYRLKAIVILNPMTTEPVQQTSLVASKVSDLLLIF